MNKDLVEAREFVDTELFTDGAGQNARRLVMEFHENQFPGTGWSKYPVADRVLKFAQQYATEQVKAERKRIVEQLEQLLGQNGAEFHSGNQFMVAVVEYITQLSTEASDGK